MLSISYLQFFYLKNYANYCFLEMLILLVIFYPTNYLINWKTHAALFFFRNINLTRIKIFPITSGKCTAKCLTSQEIHVCKFSLVSIHVKNTIYRGMVLTVVTLFTPTTSQTSITLSSLDDASQESES